ncbi:unnamed protein product [Lactuca saligna]|uniref:Uncharacterized protein n=1 Tax=Lactuca saligna TaxID=75948 RepID=A0AA35Y2Q0_LACSI|nr:unnamed protein product [Lactuca saligna]
MICISGRKGGADEICQSGTFNEMKSNLQWKKNYILLMYPRFLQFIFNDQYPNLERTGKTLDMKSLGQNTFGLIKQHLKGSKVVFRETSPLVMFGRFAEIEEALVPQDITIHEPEVVADVTPPVAIMAEEHVPVHNVVDHDNEEGERIDEEGVERGFNDDDFMFDFELCDDDICSLFGSDEVNEVMSSPTETRELQAFSGCHLNHPLKWMPSFLFWIQLRGFLPEKLSL